MNKAALRWVVGHPERDPCYCLATGLEVEIDVGCGKTRRGPRFLLAVRVEPKRRHTWRLWDSKNKEWLSDDLGDDRMEARDKAEDIIRALMRSQKVEAANELPLCDRCGHQPAKDYDVRLCSECFDHVTVGLSTLQVNLLQRARDAAISIPLEHTEIAAANGLVARHLARTHRPGKTSSILAARPRYRKGTIRHLSLTVAGVDFIDSLRGGGA